MTCSLKKCYAFLQIDCQGRDRYGPNQTTNVVAFITKIAGYQHLFSIKFETRRADQILTNSPNSGKIKRRIIKLKKQGKF